ncbi:S-layer homology domain-containing protein [Paenibacillus periandrae]|uniref:S-layer homology domain-containing protein n=1 Tax=Paenibacillus periandrae TaxID=1761741 RepID=UPI001F09DD5D|nr:S-layer homology domain-containing protein [Paenibacillus periandrae]
MKKKLSVGVSLSVMFLSLALGSPVSAKSSIDFADLNDLDAVTRVKYDSLISAGVFDGVSEGKFGLKDKMNRAQFAKAAAIIFGLKVDHNVTTSTFIDVKASDPANGYALPYIDAIVKAGLTDGYAPGQFNPAGEVTKEQLATFLIRGLGKDTEARATTGLNDQTVSTWARSYAALAIQLKLLTKNEDGTFDGVSPATRDLLVLSSYESTQHYKPVGARYAIASFRVSSFNAFTVQINGSLPDLSMAKLNLTRNGSPVTSGYKTTWSVDKSTATLTFDNKLDEATWTVTLDGLSNIDATGKTAQFVTTKETISSIAFLSTSDSLPNEKRIRIDFRAANQYGVASALTANNFNISTSKGSVIFISGEQAFYLDLPDGLVDGEKISISIVLDGSNMQVSRVFQIGDKRPVPLNDSNISKTAASVEFGKFIYTFSKGEKPSGNEADDDKFYVPIIVTDAQGYKLTPQEIYDQRAKFNIFASGGLTLAADPISNIGFHKGMIAIANVISNDRSTITIQLRDNPNVKSVLSIGPQ